MYGLSVGVFALRAFRVSTDLTPLSSAEITAFAELLDSIGDQTGFPLELEALDGFIAALHCSPREITPAEYLPVLLGEDYQDAFTSTPQFAEFIDYFNRRWHDVAACLAHPVEDLSDPAVLMPMLNDWEATLAEMTAEEQSEVNALDIAYYGMAWAEGFIWVVEYWEDEWTLPAGHALEDTLDELLDPFYILTVPDVEQSEHERRYTRQEWVGEALGNIYDLCRFWQRMPDSMVSNPVSAEPATTRSDLCPCGSGKKFKKCCGSPDKLH